MSQYEVDVLPEAAVREEWQSAVRSAAVAALEDQGQEPPAGCSILLTDDERLQRLNREFLGDDKATDVLSFPAGEPAPGQGSYLGDIAISVPTAERQARSGGHHVSAELQLLSVHAVLHLLGYDHQRAADKAKMWETQARILGELGADVAEPAGD